MIKRSRSSVANRRIDSRPMLAALLALFAVGCSLPAVAADRQPAGGDAARPPVATPTAEPPPPAEPEGKAGVLRGGATAADFDRLAARGATSTAPPVPSIEPVPVAAEPQPFAVNLYGPGDWVQQYTFEWCVAASVQMAWNMVHPDVRAARDDQAALWEMARDRSNNPYRGADPGGWAALLNDIGLGPYELVSVPEYGEALRVASQAMRDTNRPVGLVMWRGRHAWVMSGFESIGDPSVHEDFTVTGIRVVDPLYPYGSGTWGPSPEPNQLLSPDQLATQFVFREQRRWSSHIPAGFLLVLPIAPEPTPPATPVPARSGLIRF